MCNECAGSMQACAGSVQRYTVVYVFFLAYLDLASYPGLPLQLLFFFAAVEK